MTQAEAWTVEDAFREAARAFADQVRSIAAPRAGAADAGRDVWAGPGLGAWDLCALVGHTARALVTVETYLGQPADVVAVASPEAYYAAIAPILRSDDDADAIVERGRAAGRALGDDPAAAVDGLVERVLPLVDRDDDPLITTIAGGMHLRAYLPTRTFELVVHGLDIAAAVGAEPPGWSAELLSDVVRLAAGAAVLQGKGVPLLRALTGRAALPEGYSVV